MIISEKNLDIWYKEYINQRKRSEKYIKSRKGIVLDTKSLTRAEFAIDFRSESTDNPKLSGKDIAKRMAKQEVYPLTYKEAMNYAKMHSKAIGEPVNPYLIQSYRMQSNTTIFDIIKEAKNSSEAYQWQMNKYGKVTTYTQQLYINQEFFGST